MNRTLKTWTSTGVVAAALMVGLRVQPAAADVRIQARVSTPHLRVELSNLPSRHFQPGIVCRVGGRDCDRLAGCGSIHLSRYDYRVGSQLARLSGLSRRALLAERAHGLSWDQIGRRHHLQRRWLRASYEFAANEHGRRDRDDRRRDHDRDDGRRDRDDDRGHARGR